MSSPVEPRSEAARGWRRSAAAAALSVLLPAAAVGALAVAGCQAWRESGSALVTNRLYPPPPQVPRVVALQTLSGGPGPSQAEVDLAMFLFGAEPPPPLMLAQPTSVSSSGGELLICDPVLDGVYRWDAASGDLQPVAFNPPPDGAFAIDLAPDGSRLVCDRGGVHRYDQGGKLQQSYALAGEKLRPGGVLAVGDQVWVTNQALHRIEAFDAASGAYQRSIGRCGRGPGEFGLPRGMARAPDGSVYVVDMLNNRVQVLDADGAWQRTISGPGDAPGTLGRPKDVAVGLDGTVFVTDAFSQRVQAFTAEGRPLLAFGEPGSGPAALNMPAGVATCPAGGGVPAGAPSLPENSEVAYYVVVAEQLRAPGVRVFAWLKWTGEEPVAPPPAEPATRWKPSFPESAALNPHWRADHCTACHKQVEGEMAPIAPEAVDGLCLSCHDGVKAPADPHPIGRNAQTELVSTPADWPTVDGTIGCLTCHDIQRHCDPAARRPAVNAVLLRGYDPQRPLAYCSTCHRADVGGRFSPHRQRDATGEVREDACLFCHTQRPEVPADGRRQFHPHLRTETSDVCLNCHQRHWDLSPKGHVDRPVTMRIREWMLVRELSLSVKAPLAELERLAANSPRHPALLPLGNGCVTCYTCHNPHYTGLFPPDSELGALATNPDDRRSALRTNWIDLCSDCHQR